jgi:DNA-binding response OmpR family regulator
MPRLLIINDEADLLDVCQLILESAGYTVATVAHADRGLLVSAVHRFKPDLILLDLVMPVAPGEEVARWLREDARATAIPILIMSALSDGDARARHLRAAGFLKKPFTDDELVNAVRSTVSESQRCQPPPEAP